MRCPRHVFKLVLLMSLLLFTSGCSYRIADLTIASTKLHTIQDSEQAEKRVEGKSFGIFGEGASLGDAIDDALQQAGPDYDLLIDVVVRCKSYLVVEGFVVEGTAIDSQSLQPLQRGISSQK